jgi:hypothetical protein
MQSPTLVLAYQDSSVIRTETAYLSAVAYKIGMGNIVNASLEL